MRWWGSRDTELRRVLVHGARNRDFTLKWRELWPISSADWQRRFPFGIACRGVGYVSYTGARSTEYIVSQKQPQDSSPAVEGTAQLRRASLRD